MTNRAAAALLPAPTRPHLQLIQSPMTEHDDGNRNTPTDIAPPPSEPERDTMPPGAADAEASRAMQTMLPGAGGPSYLDEAIRLVAEAGRDIREGRQERLAADAENAANQRAILAAVQDAERKQTANHRIVMGQIESWRAEARAKDVQQDDRLDAVERAIADLKHEILAALPQAMADILEPYIDRIEALEREAATLRAANAGPTADAAPEDPEPT